MKKVYTQAKKVPACPRCEDIAAWKHDAKGRWWCKTCNKAFTPGITGANLAGRGSHALKKDQKQDQMRITKNKLKDQETSEDLQAYGLFDGQMLIKAEEAHDIGQDSTLYARRLSNPQLLDLCPSSSSLPTNKIRRITTRRASSERFRQMFEEGGEYENLLEAGDSGEIDPMVSEDTKPTEAVRTRGERPKKAPYACPHTDKPYYAKGKCRPCYWADWRREGGKKGTANKCALANAEAQLQAQQQQLAFDANGTSPESQKLNKRKKMKNPGFNLYDTPSQKKLVTIDDAQSVAFKLNKASDFQSMHDLLLELRSFYITCEILKGSHLLLVVKRLTQNPSTAVSELAKALFEEFAEILNEQRESANNSPMNLSTDEDLNLPDPTNMDSNKYILQTNYVTNNNGNFATFAPSNGMFVGADFGMANFNNPAYQQANLQAHPNMYMTPTFQIQNQPTPAFSQPSPTPLPKPRGRRPSSANSQATSKAVPFTMTHSFAPSLSPSPSSTDPLAALILNNNKTNVSPYSSVPSSPMVLPPNLVQPTALPPSSPALSISPMTSPLASPLTSPLTSPLPSGSPANQMRLVQEITMMNSALAQITNMNYNMLNNLNVMRTQATMRPQGQMPNFQGAAAANFGQVYVGNPNPYALSAGYAFPMQMQNFVPYTAAPFDPSLQILPVSDMSSDVTNQAQAEIDVESMLQHDDDDVATNEENNGNHTLECTDYNHSPAITNFSLAGDDTSTDASAEQSTTVTPTLPSEDQFTRDNFGSEMTNDTNCNSTAELELSDNYLAFLA